MAGRIHRRGEASSRLLVERGNLEAMLTKRLQEEDPRAAINAAIAYAEFMRFSGVGTTSLLEAAASTAGQLEDTAFQAEALFRLGLVAATRSELDTARAHYEQAQPSTGRPATPRPGQLHQGPRGPRPVSRRL